MQSPRDHRCAGMTLVELLVVISILMLLASTVLPGLSATSESRLNREATRIVTAHIAQSQARALGRAEPAGFWMFPPATNLAASFALDLFFADVPPVFRGDSIPSKLSGEVLGGSVFTFALTTTGTLGAPGDLVRLDGHGPWYSLLSATQLTLRSQNNQTVYNTPWPSPGDHTFEVLRPPTKAGGALTLPASRCIDLYWSGHGGSDSSTYLANTFGSSAGPVAILFDAIGNPVEIYSAKSASRVVPTGPIYLLIGRPERAGQAYDAAANASQSSADTRGANWQYPDSMWIGINPVNGLAKTAKCVAGFISFC